MQTKGLDSRKVATEEKSGAYRNAANAISFVGMYVAAPIAIVIGTVLQFPPAFIIGAGVTAFISLTSVIILFFKSGCFLEYHYQSAN